jgi:hypothetical protein
MTTVAIMPDSPGDAETVYRAVAGSAQSVGRTAGEALDALAAQLGEEASGTLVVVQNLRPDRFFSAIQQQRLEELMARWRAARDDGSSLPAQEQAELESLIQAEVEAAARRAEALLGQLGE